MIFWKWYFPKVLILLKSFKRFLSSEDFYLALGALLITGGILPPILLGTEVSPWFWFLGLLIPVGITVSAYHVYLGTKEEDNG